MWLGVNVKEFAQTPIRICRGSGSLKKGARGLALQLLQNLPRRVRTGAPCQANARMRPAAAQEQILNRRAVTGPVEQRTHGKELIERQIAVKNLSARQAILLLQIQRR